MALIVAAMPCALSACLVAVPNAAAEEGDSAPLRPFNEGGYSIPEITGPAAPEEYPFQFELAEEQSMRQISESEVIVEYTRGTKAFAINAPPEHDVDGATVPTTLRLSGRDVVTVIVHHRAGNPAAGGAPFDYPITGGFGWEGGYVTIIVPMTNPQQAPAPAAAPEITAIPPAAAVAAAAPSCKVPPLRGLSLHGAEIRLNARHCAIGAVHLVAGTTPGRGRVVRQYRSAGTELPAGAPVALKLGPR